MSEERLAELLEGYFERALSVAEKQELQTALLHDPTARARFWEATEWRALFHQWGEQETGRQVAENLVPMAPTPPRTPRAVRIPAKAPIAARPKVVPFRRSRWVAWTLAAAAVVILGFSFGRNWFVRPVVTFVDASDARWAGAMQSARMGDMLKPGVVRLEQGLALLAFRRGARVVLEAPAELEILSDNSATLRSGRLRAQVPSSAHGFTIRTSNFSVVDTGTEFGCSVSENGSGEVHVLAGVVELKAAGSAQSVAEGRAMRITGGTVARIDVRPGAFAGEEEIERRRLVRGGDRLGAWRVASRALSRHPAALVHLDFEDAKAGTLSNRVAGSKAARRATIVDAQPAEGRWPGKGALLFNQPNARVRLSIGQTAESLTFLAWVRAEEVRDRQYLVKAASGIQVGEVDWYLYRGGTLGLGVHTTLASDPTRGWSWVHSTGVLPAKRWMLVASVLDGTQGRVSHYLDAEEIGTGMLEERAPLRIGEIDIGNVLNAPSGFGGTFRGTVDELAIFSTALDAMEIRQIFNQGAPAGGR